MKFRLFLAALVVMAAATACRADLVPNDPGYALYEWYGPTLNLPAAWGRSTGSTAVIAAVLDTGVIADTPDLLGRVLAPLYPPGVAPFDPLNQPHGTYVAGVLAMGVNNLTGGAGVGNFTILPVVVTDSDAHNASEDIAQGIRMAADAGARVINVSQSTLKYGLLDDAAAYARTKGALVFVAAGNSDSRIDMGPYPNLIFVSGTDSSDERWTGGPGGTGSSWGPYVDLAAPAQDILLASPTFTSGYGLGSGTSFATPLAAGAAALAWSINPTLTPDEVRHLLESTAVDLGTTGWDEVYGYGRIDIGAVAAGAIPEPATLALLAAGLSLLATRRRRRMAAPSGVVGLDETESL
jgi:subtilisin family serine protease